MTPSKSQDINISGSGEPMIDYNLRLNVFTCAYPARCVVVTSNILRLFERCGMLSCFVFHKQLNQNINYKLLHCRTLSSSDVAFV